MSVLIRLPLWTASNDNESCHNRKLAPDVPYLSANWDVGRAVNAGWVSVNGVQAARLVLCQVSFWKLVGIR